MFGYVTAHEPELKVKEFHKYKGYYCGLCQQLKRNYGHLGQLTLTYDMTFLIIILTSLYEKEPDVTGSFSWGGVVLKSRGKSLPQSS